MNQVTGARTGRLLSNDVGLTQLSNRIAAGFEVTGGNPFASSRTLDTLGDTEIGIWAMTPGTVTDIESDEVFIVISGRGDVHFADGEVIALRPGVAVRLRAGERTEWSITETLRKVYIAQ